MAEARCTEETARYEARLEAARKQRDDVEAHCHTLEREKAALEGELRALERRFDAEQEPVREERSTLREGCGRGGGADAAGGLAGGDCRAGPRGMQAELRSCRLELQMLTEQSEAREARLVSEAQTASALAKEMAERCRLAEQRAERLALQLEQATRSTEDEASVAARTQQMLAEACRRAEDAEEARRQAERSRYLVLHQPVGEDAGASPVRNGAAAAASDSDGGGGGGGGGRRRWRSERRRRCHRLRRVGGTGGGCL